MQLILCHFCDPGWNGGAGKGAGSQGQLQWRNSEVGAEELCISMEWEPGGARSTPPSKASLETKKRLWRRGRKLFFVSLPVVRSLNNVLLEHWMLPWWGTWSISASLGVFAFSELQGLG